MTTNDQLKEFNIEAQTQSLRIHDQKITGQLLSELMLSEKMSLTMTTNDDLKEFNGFMSEDRE